MFHSDGREETDLQFDRYLVGLLVLVVTVFLSNVFGFLQHPERVFDVYGNTRFEAAAHLAGFRGQLVTGLWLGISLIFDIAGGRRVAAFGWLLSLALFFVPLPSAADDPWLTPMLLALVGAVAGVSRALGRVLPQPAG